LPKALTVEGRDPEYDEWSNNGLDDWEKSWRVLDNPRFALKVAAEGAWQDTAAETKARANPMTDGMSNESSNQDEERDDDDSDDSDNKPSIMDLIFSRCSGLSSMPSLTYLPGGDSIADAAGSESDVPKGDWRAHSLEAAAARSAQLQSKFNASAKARQEEEEEIKTQAKAEAKAEWIKESGKLFDAALEAAFEADWAREEEEKNAEMDECWFECNEGDDYGNDYGWRYGCDDIEQMETDKQLELELEQGKGDPPAGTPLFHVDAAGKTCFDEAEARAASELIAAMKLDERVAAAMGRVKFVFPQASTSMSASHICNEDWFGSFELLQVTGVVRLQAKPEVVALALKAAVDEKKALVAEREAEKRQRLEAEKAHREAQEKAKREREQKMASEAPQEGPIDMGSSSEDEELESPKKKSKTTIPPAIATNALVSGLGMVAGVVSGATNAVLAPLRRSRWLMERVADAAADVLVPGP